MRIDRERGCYKISFESKLDLAVLQKEINASAEQVDGLMSSGELLREGEGYVLCVRHRESLKTYLEHTVFDLNQFMLLLRRFQLLLEHLQSLHMQIYDCVWDIDCIFVGGSIEDLEFVYLPGISVNTENEFPKVYYRFSDLLAVISLRVYESQIPALQALSEVVGIFSQWEDDVLLKGTYTQRPFDMAKRLLHPYCKEQNFLMRSVRKALDSMRVSQEDEAPATQTETKSFGHLWRHTERLCLEGTGLLKGRKITIQLDADIREGESLGIGRQTDRVLFRLPYPSVSRKQAMLSYQQGVWFLTDLDSMNGTFLDEIRMNPGVGYPLIRGHSFYFAHHEIGYRVKRT